MVGAGVDDLDYDLTEQARHGDVGSVGSLLARHRAAMIATAASVLRDSAEAEDAVQDASILAMANFGGLEDPGAVGAWLRSIVRNQCLQRLRARRATPAGDLTTLPFEFTPDTYFTRTSSPEGRLEESALRAWVRHAVDTLSPPLQEVTVLRYFTDITSYADIALVCGIPIGTVRSRLAKSRQILGDVLAETRYDFPDQALGHTRAAQEMAQHLIAAGNAGSEIVAFMRARSHDDIQATWIDQRTPVVRGRSAIAAMMQDCTASGVRHGLVEAVAGRELMVLEVRAWEFGDSQANDEAAPIFWLYRTQNGKLSDIRLFYPEVAAQRDDDDLRA